VYSKYLFIEVDTNLLSKIEFFVNVTISFICKKKRIFHWSKQEQAMGVYKGSSTDIRKAGNNNET
jgi:hypothetical protein